MIFFYKIFKPTAEHDFKIYSPKNGAKLD